VGILHYLDVALVIVQMIVINLYTTFQLSKNRMSKTANVFIMSIFTVFYFYIVYINLEVIERFDSFRGNGLFLGLIALYIIPTLFLLNQPKLVTITIFISAWIYSFLVFAFSVRIASVFSNYDRQLVVLISQSILYILSYTKMYKLLRDKFVYTMWNSNNRIIKQLFMLSFSLLLLIAIVNYIFIEGISTSIGFLILFLIASIALLSFNLAFNFSRVSESADEFYKKSRTDTLTGLKNREALISDLKEKISMKKPFNLVFLDLDNFKLVNDVYGHNKGDEYLIDFSKEILKKFKRTDFYRLSGDEFVLISNGIKSESTCIEINTLKYKTSGLGIEFLGLSSGYAHYPDDAENISQLLSLADERMYQIKKIKHKNSLLNL